MAVLLLLLLSTASVVPLPPLLAMLLLLLLLSDAAADVILDGDLQQSENAEKSNYNDSRIPCFSPQTICVLIVSLFLPRNVL